MTDQYLYTTNIHSSTQLQQSYYILQAAENTLDCILKSAVEYYLIQHVLFIVQHLTPPNYYSYEQGFMYKHQTTFLDSTIS